MTTPNLSESALGSALHIRPQYDLFLPLPYLSAYLWSKQSWPLARTGAELSQHGGQVTQWEHKLHVMQTQWFPWAEAQPCSYRGLEGSTQRPLRSLCTSLTGHLTPPRCVHTASALLSACAAARLPSSPPAVFTQMASWFPNQPRCENYISSTPSSHLPSRRPQPWSLPLTWWPR